MPKSPFIVSYPHATPGVTQVTHAGMESEQFTAADAQAVTDLLARHGLTEAYVVHSPAASDLWYIFSRAARLPMADVEDVEDQDEHLLTMLNLDDESTIRTPDALVPGAFVADLVELLAAVAARNPYAGSIDDFVMDAERKGFAIVDDAARWADYRQLLAL